jgi:hypothetical protein
MSKVVSTTVLLLIATSACFGQGDAPECDSSVREFFATPLRARIEAFDKKPVAEQYNLYLCGTQTRHPPQANFAWNIAKRGESAAVLLRTQLAVPQSDLTVRDIAQIVVEMRRQGTYDVVRDTALTGALRRAINGMRDADWKRYTDTLFQEATR